MFAVPPDVQSQIAVRAARLGRHLLLEKPIAFTDAEADALVEAVETAGVASVVFFTSRFQSDVRDWLAEVTAASGWLGGRAIWPGTALEEGNPFNTPWRRLKGGLWDLGPHVVSLFWASLGPVVSVTADRGLADITHLILHHASGVTSTATVTLSAPEAAGEFELALWGAPGWSIVPDRDPRAGHRAAGGPDRAGRQRPVRPRRSPVRRPVRPGHQPRADRRRAPARIPPGLKRAPPPGGPGPAGPSTPAPIPGTGPRVYC